MPGLPATLPQSSDQSSRFLRLYVGPATVAPALINRFYSMRYGWRHGAAAVKPSLQKAARAGAWLSVATRMPSSLRSAEQTPALVVQRAAPEIALHPAIVRIEEGDVRSRLACFRLLHRNGAEIEMIEQA